MDSTIILNEINDASLFELHRLRLSIDRMIEDPKRLLAARDKLRRGMRVSFLESETNLLIESEIEGIDRKYVHVRGVETGKKWRMPMYMIKLPGDEEVPLSQSQDKRGLSRDELKKGDLVGFKTRDGDEVYGVVSKLNPKTAGIKTESGSWRVSYDLLFRVVETDLNDSDNTIEVLPAVT